MLEAMMGAKVGDDVFGEDETINELEAKSRCHFWEWKQEYLCRFRHHDQPDRYKMFLPSRLMN